MHFEGKVLENILSHLIDEIFYQIHLSKAPKQDKRFTSNPLLTKALRFIEENLGDELCLEKICDELFITKGYLNKLFNRHICMSPGKYITSKRLIAAQQEIKNGMNPTQVYAKFGFHEYSTFYRNYKEFFGYSPSEEKDKTPIRVIKI